LGAFGIVPQGHLTIALRFNAGLGGEQRTSPEGTAETMPSSAVPSGLGHCCYVFPALKRRIGSREVPPGLTLSAVRQWIFLAVPSGLGLRKKVLPFLTTDNAPQTKVKIFLKINGVNPCSS